MTKNYMGGSLRIKLQGYHYHFWQFYVVRKYSKVFTFRHYLDIHLNTYTLQTCISDFISHLSYHDECAQNWHYALQITFKVTFFFQGQFSYSNSISSFFPFQLNHFLNAFHLRAFNFLWTG